MAEETSTPETQSPAAAKPAAVKKPKEPTIEEKPFGEFIEQHFQPALAAALQKQGISDLKLSFTQDKIPMLGVSSSPCWQLIGNWLDGMRQFSIYFLDEDINGKKAFSQGESGAKPSTIESFMIDERKVSLDLLLFYTLQRLNGQKWLMRN
jgi:Protein of unknown function (DUF2996)